MIRWWVHIISTCFISKAQLVAENLCLRQQLIVLKRRQLRPQLRDSDRRFWILICRWIVRWRETLIIVRPETVLGWHRQGWKIYWRWCSRQRYDGTPSPGWRRFLMQHAKEIWACDMLTVRTIWFRTLYVFFIIHHGTREVVYVRMS